MSFICPYIISTPYDFELASGALILISPLLSGTGMGNQHDDSEMEAYCDADYAGNLDTRQSTTGYVFLFHNAAISWASKSQKHLGLSTTDTEYMAMVGAGKEWLWLGQKLLILHGDNKSAIDVVKNNRYSDNLKHVDVKTKFMYQMVQNGEIELVYVPTNEMIADALTKGLPKDKLNYHSSKIGLTN